MNETASYQGGAVKLEDEVAYQSGSIVSKTLIKKAGGTMTLFAFSQGQALSEHSAPFDAFVQVLDGRAQLTIGGKPVAVQRGEAVLMPANVPHSVQALEDFKMLLTMIH